MAATRAVARLDATQARDQLRAILSGVADAVTAQAPDGRLLFANQAALDLLGFESIEELQAEPGDWMRDRFEILDEEGEPAAHRRACPDAGRWRARAAPRRSCASACAPPARSAGPP